MSTFASQIGPSPDLLQPDIKFKKPEFKLPKVALNPTGFGLSQPLRLGGNISPDAARFAIDSAIQESRKSPPDGAEKRVNNRYSISELNELDFDEIASNFKPKAFDRRPPVVKAIDLIDLPRNTNANILFGRAGFTDALRAAGVAAASGAAVGGTFGAFAGGFGALPGALIGGATAGAAELVLAAGSAIGSLFVSDETKRKVLEQTGGEFAAGGLPRIFLADGLRAMGVNNRVVRAIVGFVGDISLDPLTYLGGTGAGLRIIGKGGTVLLSKTGRKAINSAIRDVAKTQTVNSIKNESIKNYIRLVVNDDQIRKTVAKAVENGLSPETEVRNLLRRRVIGEVVRPKLHRVLLPAGFDVKATESPLARDFFLRPVAGDTTEAIARQQAATAVVKEFQRGSTLLPGFATKGAKEGFAGSEVAHLPFTDFAIRTRPFSAEAIRRVSNIRTAEAGLGKPIITEPALKILAAGKAIDTAAKDVEESLSRAKQAREAAQATGALPEVKLSKSGDVISINPAGTSEAREDISKAFDAIDSAKNAASGIQAKITDFIETIPPEQITPEAINGGVRAIQELDAIIEHAEATKRAIEDAAKSVAPLRKERAVELRKAAAELVTDEGLTEDSLAALQDIYDSYNKELDGIERSLMEMSDAEFAAFGKSHEIQLNRIRTAVAEKTAMRGPILAGLTSSDLVLIDMAKRAIGTTSDLMGTQVIGSIAKAVGGLVGENSKVAQISHAIDRTTRAAFGVRSGVYTHHIRRYLSLMRRSRMEMIEVESALARQELANILSDVLPKSEFNKNIDEIDSLVTAIAIDRITKNAEESGKAGYFRYRFDPDAPGGVKLNDDGTPALSRWAEDIENAKTGDLLKTHPELLPLLEQHADRLIQRYIDLGGQAHDDLGIPLLEAYFPNAPSNEFRKLIQTGGAIGPDAGARANAFVEGGSRTTNETRFPMTVLDEDGNEKVVWRSFFDWHRAYFDDRFSDEVLHLKYGLDSEEVARIRAQREAISFYDAQPLEFKNKYPSRPTSPQDLNELVSQGHFELLTNRGDLPRGAFETGSTRVWAYKVASQTRANSKKVLLEMLDRFGHVVDQESFNRVKQEYGRKVNLGGVEGTIVATGDKSAPMVIEIAGERFRPLNTSVINGDGELLAGGLQLDEMARMGTTALYPEIVAQQIERVFRALDKPGGLDPYLLAADKMVSIWKVYTLTHPSWLIGNVFSDIILAGAAGVAPHDLAREFKDSAKIVFSRGREGLDRVYQHGTRRMTALDILDEAVENGVVGANFVASEAKELTDSGILRISDTRALAPSAVSSRIAESFRDAAEARRLGFLPHGDKIAGLTIAASRQLKSMVSSWFKANAQIEDAIRLATYRSLINKGLPAEDAAARVIGNLFDYQDLTRIERGVFKRILPFYTWLKNSLAQQMALAFRHPWYSGLTPKLKEAFEQAAYGDSTVPEYKRPAWLREQLAIQIGSNPDRRFAFTIGSLIPQEQQLRTIAALTGIDGLQDYLNFVVSGSNPLIRSAVEIGFGRESFTDRSIGPSATTGDLSIAEHLAGQIRPLRELGNPFSVRRGAIPSAFTRSFGEGVARTVIGGRIQSFGDERIKFNNIREFKEKEEGIRSAIRIAIREGNENAGLRARIKLLELYDTALGLGLGDHVPKWAIRQLQLLKGGLDANGISGSSDIGSVAGLNG